MKFPSASFSVPSFFQPNSSFYLFFLFPPPPSINVIASTSTNSRPESEDTCHLRQLRKTLSFPILTIGVDLIDHVLQLGLGGVLSQGTHDGSQLLGGDGAISVLVEQREGLFEFGNLLLGQLISLE